MRQKRGEIHLAFAMYKNRQKPIITQASILRTIPVAFIYTFLLKLQIVMLLSVFPGEIYRKILLFGLVVIYCIKMHYVRWGGYFETL